MSKKSMSYDHPTYTARQAAQILCPAGTVNTVANKFVAWADMKIKSIQGNVLVAGTHADSAITVYLNGTTSIGAFANGTQAAGSELTAVLPDQALSEGDYIDFKRSDTNGATMASCFAVEYEVTPGADVTS